MTTVQATVKEWSPTGGAAFLADGSVVPLPPDALAGGPFRFLRPGQRVALELDDGVVLRVDLP